MRRLVGTLALAPLQPLNRGLALWRALKRGVDTYRRSRPRDVTPSR